MGRLGVGLRDKGFDEKDVGHLEANKGTSVQSVRVGGEERMHVRARRRIKGERREKTDDTETASEELAGSRLRRL